MPVEEWIEDKFYVGGIALDIYDYWKEVLIEFCNGKYNELILTGALGTGKSYVALVIFLRKIYELSCYRPIPYFLGLAIDSLVLFVYLTISITQALMSGYGKILRMVDNIPYFRDEFKRNKNKTSVIEFLTNDLTIYGGSDVTHFKGGDLFALIFDESNFRQGGLDRNLAKAIEIYTESTNRRKSRFLEKGTDKSFSIIVSSVDTSTSFTEERIKAGEDDPSVMIVRATTWQTKPHKFSENTFWCFKGTEKLDPFIETDEQALGNYFMQAKHLPCAIKDLPHSKKKDWVEVPTEFKDSFRVDIIRALADICGIAVGGSHKLFTDQSAFRECFPVDSAYEHPFTKQEVTTSFKTPERLENYIRDDYKNFDPQYLYFIHIDQSLTTDCTGLAIAHREWDDKLKITIAIVDLMIRIVPPKRPDQISIRKCREFIYWLIDQKKLEVGLMTYDQFASAEAIQEAQNKGLECGRLSVDKDSSQYDFLGDLIMLKQIKGYYYKPFRDELLNLEKDKLRRKVDHPPTGSKDVSDAVAGAVWNAMTSEEVMDDFTIRHI